MTKISNLPAYALAAITDLLAIVDNANVITKRITVQDLAKVVSTVIQPSGIMQQFAGSSAPSGWLICDGSAVSRTTYAALFAVIGTSYGAGNGTTTFNIPDLRGRIPVGLNASDTDFQTLGLTGGQKDVKAHTHGSGSYQVYANEGELQNAATNLDDFPGSGGPIHATHTQVGNLEGTSGSTGTGSTNMNPFQIVNHIIKT